MYYKLDKNKEIVQLSAKGKDNEYQGDFGNNQVQGSLQGACPLL